MRYKLLAALIVAAAPALAASPVETVRARALDDQVAWNIVEDLTTEVGPRLAGTQAEARARAWAVERLKALGFSNVRVEPFDLPVWVRGAEEAEIVSPFPQKLALTALGNSGATPAAGMLAQVAGFPSLAALEAAPDAAVRGKIVFIWHRMPRTQDGSSYGVFGLIRRNGPSIASRKGAAAILIRSIGTDHHRNPHTGVQQWQDGAKPIPAAALALPDSDNLERMLARASPVTLRLTLTPRDLGTGQSGNVIAEVPGSDPGAGIILVGGHLDSWDLGTGAIDDAAGLAVTTAAARLVMQAGKPRRTIRLVWFGAEETGIFGGNAYLAAHGREKHALVAESDFGAGRIYRIDSRVAPGALPAVARMAAALEPLGIGRGDNDGRAGPDVAPLAATGVPSLNLAQDGTDYFDLHHTPDDTLDKIDPAALRQNVAAWATMLAVAADAPEPFDPVAVK
jgi:hypothetical protein